MWTVKEKDLKIWKEEDFSRIAGQKLDLKQIFCVIQKQK